MSFTDWPWRHWRTRRADKPALRLDDVTLSWSQLGERIDRLAAGFQSQGVADGDGVMLLAHNHPQTLLAWLALLQCGARILPVNPQLPRPLLDVLLPQMTLRFALVLNGEYDGLPALALREGEGQGGRDVAGRTTGLNDAHLRLHRFAKSGGAHLCRPPCQRKRGAGADALRR